MGRPKKIEEGVRISTLISRRQFEWLQHMAIRMSNIEGRSIGVSEAIRMAIEAAYAPPKESQTEMFNS